MLPPQFTNSWKKAKLSDLKFKQEKDQQLEYFVHQLIGAHRQLTKENERLQSEIDDFKSDVRKKIEERLVPKQSKSNFTGLELSSFSELAPPKKHKMNRQQLALAKIDDNAKKARTSLK